MKWQRKLVFAGFLAIILISGCSQKTTVPENKPTPPALPASPSVLPVKPVKAEKPMEVPADEYDGVVYNGLLWKDLRQNEFDSWPLNRIARDLDIAMIELKNPPEYRDARIPLTIQIGDAPITLSLDVSNDKIAGSLQYLEMINVIYTVRKNGKPLQMNMPPFVHHGSGPYVNLEEFLGLMDLSYKLSGQTLYVGPQTSSDIQGKVLVHEMLKLGGATETDVKLVYLYNPADKPRYQSIELDIGGERLVLYDTNHPGRSDYYMDGYVESIDSHGETLVRVELGGDTVIVKKTAEHWETIFSNSQYRMFGDGNLMLENGDDGTAHFVDQINHVDKKVKVSGGKPNTSFPIDIQSFRWEETNERQISMIATIGARSEEGRNIFVGQIRFDYNGDTFVPTEIASWDERKIGEEKSAGKTISSKDDYLQFRYSVQ